MCMAVSVSSRLTTDLPLIYRFGGYHAISVERPSSALTFMAEAGNFLSIPFAHFSKMRVKSTRSKLDLGNRRP